MFNCTLFVLFNSQLPGAWATIDGEVCKNVSKTVILSTNISDVARPLSFVFTIKCDALIVRA